MQDINGNLSEVLSDELGLVKAVAVMGKGNEADELTGLSEITEVAESALVSSFFQAPDSVQLTNIGKNLLNRASARFVYDFEAYIKSGKPAVVAAITREQHFQENANSPVQIAFGYSNGIGEVVMNKVQAEPGMAKQVIVQADNSIAINKIDTSLSNPKQLRWIGNGRTIKNNKGNPVKQYEPYFSVSWQYEDFEELVETGVTPLMYYDAPGRLIKTEMPEGTFSKVEFDSWKQTVYDANDTILESSWYHDRTNRLIDAKLLAEGKDPGREKVAADKATKHANTPNVLHFDTLGRPVLSVEHNKNVVTEADEFYLTRVFLDAEGNLRTVTDARGNSVMQYKYDMLGNLVYQNSMDAGQRWLLTNILGNPLRTWDERDHEFRYFYDITQRPTHSKVIGGTTPLNNIFDKVIYGENLLTINRSNEATLQSRNVLGQVIQHYDTGGLVDTPDYDFKGQPLATTRKLFRKYKEVSNWTDGNLAIDLEPGTGFTFTTQTDALGRITQQTAPDDSIITPSYNEAGLLNNESVQHFNPAKTTEYIKNIDYNEKGQRKKIIYGNNVSTRFYYDKETFRLKRLDSKRKNGDPLQDWYYIYDPVGNIAHIEDKNIPVVFFDNQKVTGVSTYTYDALYRLAEATGRENNAALSFGTCDNWNDKPFIHAMNPGDPMAVRNYTQRYQYDVVGNIMEMKHLAIGGNWTRGYEYETANNRIKSTSIGDNGNPANYTKYQHHAKHGYLEELPHLEKISWNFKEEVVLTTRQHCTNDNIPVITYYQYDGSGQRIRKITENQAAAGDMSTKKEERIYIAGYELYKKHSGTNAGLERVSLSLMDEGHRFVMIETRNDVDDGTKKQLVRYQLHNHLGSASLELDTNAQVISYEEYHPYGTTAYQAKNAVIKSAAKRYRYTGMERDEETGLEYHSARYYLPWLGRWSSADPMRIKGGLNLYVYAANNPNILIDYKGLNPRRPKPPKPTASYGDMKPHSKQDLAIREGTVRISEHEHIRARINLVLQTTDPATGLSPYDSSAYSRSMTLTIPEDMARIKTRMDMALRDRLKAAVSSDHINQQLIDDISIEADIERTKSARDQAISIRQQSRVYTTTDLEAITNAKIIETSHLQNSELHHVGKAQRFTMTAAEIDAALKPLDEHLIQREKPVAKPVARVESKLVSKPTALTPEQWYSPYRGGRPGVITLDPAPSAKGTGLMIAAIIVPPLVEKGLTKLGASERVVETGGFLASVGTGALVGGVASAEVGAIPGAAIGAVIGAVGYLSQNYELCLPFYNCD